MRLYAYLFHFLLGAFLFLLGFYGAISANNQWNLGMMPWTGSTLTKAMLGMGVLAVLSVLLAATGWLRFLLPLWALVVVVLTVRGFFLPPYVFPSPDAFREAAWFTFAAIGAFLSSLAVFDRRAARRSYR